MSRKHLPRDGFPPILQRPGELQQSSLEQIFVRMTRSSSDAAADDKPRPAAALKELFMMNKLSTEQVRSLTRELVTYAIKCCSEVVLLEEACECADLLLTISGKRRIPRLEFWTSNMLRLVVSLMTSRSTPAACKGLLMVEKMFFCAPKSDRLCLVERFEKLDGPVKASRAALDALFHLLSPVCRVMNPEQAFQSDHSDVELARSTLTVGISLIPKKESIPQEQQQQHKVREVFDAVKYAQNTLELMKPADSHVIGSRELAQAYMDGLQLLIAVSIPDRFPSRPWAHRLPNALSRLLQGSMDQCSVVTEDDAKSLVSLASDLAKLPTSQPVMVSGILSCVLQILNWGRTNVSNSLLENRELLQLAADWLKAQTFEFKPDTTEPKYDPDYAYEVLSAIVLGKCQQSRFQSICQTTDSSEEQVVGHAFGQSTDSESASSPCTGSDQFSLLQSDTAEDKSGKATEISGAQLWDYAKSMKLLQTYFNNVQMRHYTPLIKSMITDNSQDQLGTMRCNEFERLEKEGLLLENQKLKMELQQEQKRLEITRRDQLQASQTERERLTAELHSLKLQYDQELLRNAGRHATHHSAMPLQNTPVATQSHSEASSEKNDGLVDFQPRDEASGVDGLKEAQQTVETLFNVISTASAWMQEALCASLKHLGPQLYSSPTHFLYELIQNADDCNSLADRGSSGSTDATLEVSLHPNCMLISNTGPAIQPQDVQYLCSIGKSAKVPGQHIGHKGLGFKSVFACTNSPHIFSGLWRFKFSVPEEDGNNNELGYIMPIWVGAGIPEESMPSEVCSMAQAPNFLPKTCVYLPFKSSFRNSQDMQALRCMLDPDMDPSGLEIVLLNMRHLRTFEVRHYSSSESLTRTVIMTKQHDASPSIPVVSLSCQLPDDVEIARTDATLSTTHVEGQTRREENVTFQLFTCTVRVPADVARKHSKSDNQSDETTKIRLSFPMRPPGAEEDCQKWEHRNFQVFAGLPITDFRLPFVLDCDWVLVTSRQSVLDCPWNCFLRDTSASLLVGLLTDEPKLRERFLDFIPSHIQDVGPWWRQFFEKIRNLVKSELLDGSVRYRSENPELMDLVDPDDMLQKAGIELVPKEQAELLREVLEPLSLRDILDSLPTDHGGSNTRFLEWVVKRPDWLERFFGKFLLKSYTVADLLPELKTKPIFLPRPSAYSVPDINGPQFCSIVKSTSSAADSIAPLVVHCPDANLKMWRTQVTIVDGRSAAEREVIIRLLETPELTPSLLSETLAEIHLAASFRTDEDPSVIWQDLRYLRDHKSAFKECLPVMTSMMQKGMLGVPARDGKIARAQELTISTILGLDFAENDNNLSKRVASLPLTENLLQFEGSDEVTEAMKWELFFLEMGCQPPKPPETAVAESFSFPPKILQSDSAAHLACEILKRQGDDMLEFIRKISVLTLQGSRKPISSVVDDAAIPRGQSLPSIEVPMHARNLAEMLNVTCTPGIDLAIKGLHSLRLAGTRDVSSCLQWLRQLEVALAGKAVDEQAAASRCRREISIFLPDYCRSSDGDWVRLDCIICLEEPAFHKAAITTMCQLMGMATISSETNSTYRDMVPFLLKLGCKLKVYKVKQAMDKLALSHEYFDNSGCDLTVFTEQGRSEMISLCKLMEGMLHEQMKGYEKGSIYSCNPSEVETAHINLRWRRSLMGEKMPKLGDIIEDESPGSQERNYFDFCFVLHDGRAARSTAERVVACLPPALDSICEKNNTVKYLSPELVKSCPLLMAALCVPYFEHNGSYKLSVPKSKLSEVSKVFNNTLNKDTLNTDPVNVMVVTTATRTSLPEQRNKTKFGFNLSLDATICDGNGKRLWERVKLSSTFLIFEFNKTIVCVCDICDKRDQENRVMFVSALARMLEVMRGLPAETAQREAEIALSQVESAQALLNHEPCENWALQATGTSQEATTNELLFAADTLLLPRDDPNRNRNLIFASDGSNRIHVLRTPSALQFHEITPAIFIAEDFQRKIGRIASNNGNARRSPTNTEKQMETGVCAELFMFDYLSTHYKEFAFEWVSSARAKFLGNDPSIDDGLGYDFVFPNVSKNFVDKFPRKCTPQEEKMTCYIEVKGCAVEWDGVCYLSRNEKKVRDEAAGDSRRKAYFVAVVDLVDTPEKTRLVTVIKWSQGGEALHLEPESFRATLNPPSALSQSSHSHQRDDVHSADHVLTGNHGGSYSRAVQPGGGPSSSRGRRAVQSSANGGSRGGHRSHSDGTSDVCNQGGGYNHAAQPGRGPSSRDSHAARW